MSKKAGIEKWKKKRRQGYKRVLCREIRAVKKETTLCEFRALKKPELYGVVSFLNVLSQKSVSTDRPSFAVPGGTQSHLNGRYFCSSASFSALANWSGQEVGRNPH